MKTMRINPPGRPSWLHLFMVSVIALSLFGVPSKHVKALVQVGQARSNHYATAMGYPAELVPMEHPFSLSSGATLRLRTLVDGKPAANQYVLYGGRTANDGGIEQKSTRSNAEGIASVPLTQAGIWYVKFINMVPVRGDSVTHESKWATITFQIR